MARDRRTTSPLRSTSSTSSTSSTVVTWIARAAWATVAVLGGSAIGSALDERSRAVQLTGTVGAWVGFGVGALALLVPATATLTTVRVVVPATLVVCAATALAGAEPDHVAALLAPAAVATAAVATAEFGRPYLQASAYGDERRFGLRPPIGYLAAVAVSWLVTVAATVAAVLGAASRVWPLAVAGGLLAVGGWLTGPRRWHQLSRRWFVLVPAGVVVHDPVVLGETLMAPRQNIAAIVLDDVGTAGADGRATDLTGPTPGLAVEVRLRQPVPALINPTLGTREGAAVSVGSYVVSPTRPGAVVRAAAAAGFGA